jgi:hypothetical protein
MCSAYRFVLSWKAACCPSHSDTKKRSLASFESFQLWSIDLFRYLFLLKIILLLLFLGRSSDLHPSRHDCGTCICVPVGAAEQSGAVVGDPQQGRIQPSDSRHRRCHAVSYLKISFGALALREDGRADSASRDSAVMQHDRLHKAPWFPSQGKPKRAGCFVAQCRLQFSARFCSW